jgi:hypothetical protein
MIYQVLGVFPDNEILGNPANPLPCAVGHFDVSVAVGYEKAVMGRLENVLQSTAIRLTGFVAAIIGAEAIHAISPVP